MAKEQAKEIAREQAIELAKEQAKELANAQIFNTYKSNPQPMLDTFTQTPVEKPDVALERLPSDQPPASPVAKTDNLTQTSPPHLSLVECSLISIAPFENPSSNNNKEFVDGDTQTSTQYTDQCLNTDIYEEIKVEEEVVEIIPVPSQELASLPPPPQPVTADAQIQVDLQIQVDAHIQVDLCPEMTEGDTNTSTEYISAETLEKVQAKLAQLQTEYSAEIEEHKKCQGKLKTLQRAFDTLNDEK